jgi:hypothetical protein
MRRNKETDLYFSQLIHTTTPLKFEGNTDDKATIKRAPTQTSSSLLFLLAAGPLQQSNLVCVSGVP